MTDVWELADLWAGRFITRSPRGRKEALAEIFTEQLEARNKAVEDALAAFKQEVSDAITEHYGSNLTFLAGKLSRFVISKANPLREAMDTAFGDGKRWSKDNKGDRQAFAEATLKALEAQGARIVWENEV